MTGDQIDTNEMREELAINGYIAQSDVAVLLDALDAAREQVTAMTGTWNEWVDRYDVAVDRAKKAEAQIAAVRAHHERVIRESNQTSEQRRTSWEFIASLDGAP